MTPTEINEAEWSDPANWKWGIYRSEKDTRVWVSKKPKWAGWTLNFAHAASVWWLLALLTPGWIIAIVVVYITSRG